MNEHPDISERFLKAQAEYRSQGITTPAEWPMDTPEGRESYRKSMERQRFLDRMNGAQEAIARAEARLSNVPHGAVINFDELLYGGKVQ